MGIHFLCYFHGNEHTWTHDAISQHLCCHCVKCWLPCRMKTTTCTSFNHIQLLSLMNWHCVHQIQHLCLSRHCHCLPNASGFTSPIFATQRFVTFDAVQAKEKSYRDQHPIDQFLPLIVEVFGCLHKQAYVFLHDRANAIWGLKRLKGPPIFVLVTFLCQIFFITLQIMQASPILNQVVAIGLAISQLPPLEDTPPITMAHLL
jgi:hypothetical protein